MVEAGHFALVMAFALALIQSTVPLIGARSRHERMMAALRGLYLDRLRAHGSQLAPEVQMRLLAMDVELNAQGLAIWLDRQGL